MVWLGIRAVSITKRKCKCRLCSKIIIKGELRGEGLDKVPYTNIFYPVFCCKDCLGTFLGKISTAVFRNEPVNAIEEILRSR